MKRVLLVALMMSAAPGLARDLASGQLLTATTETSDVPADLHFGPSQTQILNANWVVSLFGTKCDSLLSESSDGGSLTLRAISPSRIEFRLNGRAATVLNQAESRYIPVHYRNAIPVHPSFQLRLPGWVTLHLEIHRSAGKKTLRLFVIQGRPGQQRLVPILVSSEI